MKDSKNKVNLKYIPFDVLEEVAKLFQENAEKHKEKGYDFEWKKAEPDEYEQALLRHISSYIQGEKVDPDSSRLTALHILANSMIVCYHELERVKNEQRKRKN